MDLRFEPSVARGTAVVPPSKSVTHRLLICAGLAEGESRIVGGVSRDLSATVGVLRAAGAKIEEKNGEYSVSGGCRFSGNQTFFCGESGSTLRFWIPVSLPEGGRFTGSPRLFARPLSVYEDLFSSRGISFVRTEDGISVRGELRPGVFEIPGDVSSQFASGLLFALPRLSGDSVLRLTGSVGSAGYLTLTLQALARAGVCVEQKSDREFFIPGNQTYRPFPAVAGGDESAAAVLGALGENVRLSGRTPGTEQPDGVWEKYFALIDGGDALIDVDGCPDLAPILTVKAVLSGHRVVLTGTGRLKGKESDRGAGFAAVLRGCGAAVTAENDRIVIAPAPLHAPEHPLDGSGDHRTVMALSVLCSSLGGIVTGCEAVEKSFPAFFSVLRGLGVKFTRVSDDGGGAAGRHFGKS